MLVACRVWDTETLECVKVLEGHNEAVLALAVGPTFLVSGSYDTSVRFWALDSLRCVRCAEPSCLNIAESLSDMQRSFLQLFSPSSSRSQAYWTLGT
jgi:WD40 repeat protein